VAAASHAGAAVTGPLLEPATADHALMERVLQEVGAPRAVPTPGAGDYLADLMQRLIARLGQALGFAIDRTSLAPLAWAVSGLLLVAALAVVAWLIVRGRRGRAAPAPPEAARPVAERREAVWSGERWQQELERLLAAGDARGALSALWWWMARRLAAERAQESWTSQELLRHAGRADLAPLAVAVDRLAYGVAAPRAADVARVYARLSGALA
jgi:hypothetical protein